MSVNTWKAVNTWELALSSIPPTSRVTVSAVAEYLRTQGYEGSVNDVISAWLEAEGYIGAFNDAFSKYLAEIEGLTGSFTDKLGNWRKQ